MVLDHRIHPLAWNEIAQGRIDFEDFASQRTP
jgi:hypothetical protein